jgi:hypothetical protein
MSYESPIRVITWFVSSFRNCKLFHTIETSATLLVETPMFHLIFRIRFPNGQITYPSQAWGVPDFPSKRQQGIERVQEEEVHIHLFEIISIVWRTPSTSFPCRLDLDYKKSPEKFSKMVSLIKIMLLFLVNSKFVVCPRNLLLRYQ